MLSISKEFHFAAAHMIVGHSKCGRLHGHNYKVEVVVSHPKHNYQPDEELDELGFVIDFGVLKSVVKKLLDRYDHRYMVSNANRRDNCPYVQAAEKYRPNDIVHMPIDQTSAEHLALYFKESIQEALADQDYGHVAVMEVVVWETPASCARG
jgi:6-pyruvoyltetrahydropterin/6-carboxytetrahydropterin synthase